MPGVATVVLDRPDKLNVFSGGMGGELSAAYEECDADPEVRVIVLTGRGRAFCAGADMAPESASFGTPGAGFSSQPLKTPAWSLSTPVIAAIQGHAIGIGFTIALQADLRIVAEDAKLAIPQARRGMIGDAGSHWTVRRFAGQAVAADVLLTGRTFRGSEARDDGPRVARAPGRRGAARRAGDGGRDGAHRLPRVPRPLQAPALGRRLAGGDDPPRERLPPAADGHPRRRRRSPGLDGTPGPAMDPARRRRPRRSRRIDAAIASTRAETSGRSR